MKKIIGFGIKASTVAGALLGFALTASAAGTWTAPTATPPANNVDAPVNVGTSAQWKAGGFGVGRTSAPAWFGPTTGGSVFDVNGVTSMNGIANFGASALVQHVTIGTPPCVGIGCGSSSTSGGTTGGSSSTGPTGMIVPHVAQGGSGIFAKINDALTNFFGTKTAVAAGSGSGGGSCPTDNGYCTYTTSTGAAATGMCVFTDTGWDCRATTGTGTGSGSGAGTGSTSVWTIEPPVISMAASPTTISSSGSASITWSASNASACAAYSSNASNNWNATLSISGSTHTGSGTKALGTFSVPGSYTYNISCSSPSGGAASAIATVTVGPTYILDVYGNSFMHGYVDVSSYLNAGSLKQGGIPVCLQNGTNCPSASFGPYPKIYSDMTNEYAVYGANAASGGGTRVQISGSSIRLGTSVSAPVMSIEGDQVTTSGTSNRNGALFQITSTGTGNGDNADGTERGLTIAASSVAAHGKLLNVKRGSTELFSVNGNGSTYVPKLVIGPSASGDGIPLYRINSHCVSGGTTMDVALPLTTQQWCYEGSQNLWWNDKNAPRATPGSYAYYAGKQGVSGGCTTPSGGYPSGSSGCSYTPVPVGYISAN